MGLTFLKSFKNFPVPNPLKISSETLYNKFQFYCKHFSLSFLCIILTFSSFYLVQCNKSWDKKNTILYMKTLSLYFICFFFLFQGFGSVFFCWYLVESLDFSVPQETSKCLFSSPFSNQTIFLMFSVIFFYVRLSFTEYSWIKNELIMQHCSFTFSWNKLSFGIFFLLRKLLKVSFSFSTKFSLKNFSFNLSKSNI